MRIHCLQHVPFEDLGYIATWIKDKEFQLSYTRFYENPQLPSLDDFDWLIVLGGPMAVQDEELFPWLKAEKEFIKMSIEADKLVLGICLGAQLIAHVLGAKVYPNKFTEIGWFPVEVFAATHQFNFPQNKIMVFHWHSDTFDLPEDATLTASSRACVNQGFRYKQHVIGLQFHLEVTSASIHSMIKYCESDLVSNAFVQSAYQIINYGENYMEQNHNAMRLILEHQEALKTIPLVD